MEETVTCLLSHGHGTVAVVVEDCVSAIAVVGNEVYVGVACVGYIISQNHISRYLSQFSTAIIALDPDALPKTTIIC
jgi:hypothetical protein